MLIPCEAERADPVVGCFCCGVAETVRETDSSPLYFTKDIFDGIPISMVFISKIVACSMTRSL